MTDRYDDVRATPDPVLAEQLRQRLHAQMEHGWLDDRAVSPRLRLAPPESTDEFVPMEEIHMTTDSPDTEHKNRWWFVAAAAALVVVGLGAVALVIDRDDGGDDGVQQAPTTTAIQVTTVAPRLEEGHFTGAAPKVSFTYVLPDGWIADSGGWLVVSDDLTVNFWDVANLYADGCQWETLDPVLGPTVDELANAWAGLPGFTATTPIDITVDGYVGKQLDYTVPEYVADDCADGKFGLWSESTVGSSPNFWAQVPGQQNRQVILDIDGARMVINAWANPDATPDDLAALDEILSTLQIN